MRIASTIAAGLAGLAGLLVLLALIGLLLPSERTVSRSLAMQAPASVIYDHIADLREFHEWSPWAYRDPNMEVSFEGEDKGAGAIMYWDSESEGSGRLEILQAEPGAFIIYEIDFGAGQPARGRFEIEPEGHRQRVTWSMTAQLDAIHWRYIGLFLDTMIGPDFLNGLTYLKMRVEAADSPFEQ
ncbi:SRPBCC family protein [Natronospira bacteriovora]|uniref:SRPBCC family protein n=1 Tax=Natronospira bacteriovora TaxID=3069753 RepID=A0ABU0WAK2_9GAMM|nr:SRPBCC family protein [Natronospira sp. AB-CW4]MDQ2070495.1 SRPBCC family protein [Natronospira sp. AB-CW4]